MNVRVHFTACHISRKAMLAQRMMVDIRLPCRADSTSTKMVTWKSGTYVFFRAIMDTHLIKYLQPFFVEDTQFWFKKLRKKPVPPLMVNFVNGLVANEVYSFCPALCGKMLSTHSTCTLLKYCPYQARLEKRVMSKSGASFCFHWLVFFDIQIRLILQTSKQTPSQWIVPML